VGGSLSLAAGVYVSVSSQRDVEEADLARETEELRTMPDRELAELAAIYARQGLPMKLAKEVAVAMTARDGLAAHAREELGIDVKNLSRPVQAAVSSAVSFAIGSALPLCAMAVVDDALRVPVTLGAATVALGLLGGWSARLGGAPVGKAVLRLVVGGAAAMGLTMAVGRLFGVAA
jgi:VIT1/CCC1 family predicted Fe2+/Mn2+ transporter